MLYFNVNNVDYGYSPEIRKLKILPYRSWIWFSLLNHLTLIRMVVKFTYTANILITCKTNKQTSR